MPPGVVPAKSDDGVYSPARKYVQELGKVLLEHPSAAQGLETKQRRRCRLIKALSNCVWYELEDFPHPMTMDGKLIYFLDDTEGGNNIPSPEPEDPESCFACMVSHLQIIDDMDEVHDGKNIIFVTTDGHVVGYKLGRRERAHISLKKWRQHAKTIRLGLETQRNNPRGTRLAGFFARYVLFGFRREGNGKHVSRYVAKKSANKYKVALASLGLQDMVTDLKNTGLNLVSGLELSVQNLLRDGDALGDVLINGYKGRFSQLAIATNYWSPLHIDKDIFRTLLSCFCEKSMKAKHKDDILFYFVFPSVGIWWVLQFPCGVQTYLSLILRYHTVPLTIAMRIHIFSLVSQLRKPPTRTFQTKPLLLLLIKLLSNPFTFKLN